MGYSVFKFGALYLDDKAQPVPQKPERGGDIPLYDGQATISIASGSQEKSITWIKPNDLSILIADRVLLISVRWEDLKKNGFVEGKPILIGGEFFRCRLLRVGGNENVFNEWDRILDKTGEDDNFWHWKKMFSLGAEISAQKTARCAVRGYYSARYWKDVSTVLQCPIVGFRPVLEPLPSDNPTPNISLEGLDFQLSRLPGNDTFCPILQPTQEDMFKDIPVGGKVRMYTFLEGGKPIHFGATVKDTSKLTLTDRYFGDEYLVSWVISNGIAVASQSMKQQI